MFKPSLVSKLSQMALHIILHLCGKQIIDKKSLLLVPKTWSKINPFYQKCLKFFNNMFFKERHFKITILLHNYHCYHH